MGRAKRNPTNSREPDDGFRKSSTHPTTLKFDHRAARQRDVAGDADGTALGELKRGVLLVIDVLARRAVDRDDDLVAALHRFLRGADGGALERVAADDHGLDAGLLEHRLERRAQEFVRPGLAVPIT